MRVIYVILFGLSLFSCTNSTHQDNIKPLKEVENEMLKLVTSYFKSTIGIEEDFDFQKFSKLYSPEYKEYICNEAHTENFDSTIKVIIQFSQNKMNELKEKGAVIQTNEMFIKERFQKRDTLVYLIQTEILMIAENKNKKLTNTDYILAITNNYGDQWYLYQADIPNINNLLSYRLDNTSVREVSNLIKKHKPNSKIEELR